MVHVELTGGPQLSVNAEGRMEALLPTSQTASVWRRAFTDALPSRLHTARINARGDGITIVFDNERQFSQYVQAAIDALAAANRKIDALDSRLRELTLSGYANQPRDEGANYSGERIG